MVKCTSIRTSIVWEFWRQDFFIHLAISLLETRNEKQNIYNFSNIFVREACVSKQSKAIVSQFYDKNTCF